MPLKYWDQAFLATTHLINHTPSKTLGYDTPLHCLLSAQPDYFNLRVFGCMCWPNLHPYNSHKLQFQSTRCVFLGYSNHHKGYKCLDVSTGHVYISLDVVFDENLFPFATYHPIAGTRYTSDILLLQSSSSWESTDLPMNNSPAVSCLPNPVLWTNQILQLKTIPGSSSVLGGRSDL
jgi:hypothetical protein